MKDEKYTPEVGTWLKGREVAPRDSQVSARRVATRLPHIRQRSRWWPFPPLYRRNRTASTFETRENPSSPIPATNGRSPTVIGRTMTMFSPARTIITAALVFGVGGVYLIAQPFQQQSTVPGANVDAEPVWVTGNITHASSCSIPDITVDGDVTRSRTYVCSPQTWTASDPRFSGEVARLWNDDVYETDNGRNAVHVDADYLQNDAGGWTCTSIDLVEGSGLFSTGLTGTTATCVGQGGYEGLSAILVEEDTAGDPFVGLIFPGDFPPLPEPPAAE